MDDFTPEMIAEIISSEFGDWHDRWCKRSRNLEFDSYGDPPTLPDAFLAGWAAREALEKVQSGK